MYYLKNCGFYLYRKTIMQDTWSLPGKKRMWMEYLFHTIRLSFDYFCWLFSNVLHALYKAILTFYTDSWLFTHYIPEVHFKWSPQQPLFNGTHKVNYNPTELSRLSWILRKFSRKQPKQLTCSVKNITSTKAPVGYFYTVIFHRCYVS